MRLIFALLPTTRDRLAALATCRSWRAAARALDAVLWGALDASRAETPAQAAARRSAHGLLHRGPGPTSAAALVGLASLLATVRPSTSSQVGLFATHPAAATPLQRLERLVNRGRLAPPTPRQTPPPPSIVDAWRGASLETWDDRDLDDPEYLWAAANPVDNIARWVFWALGLVDVAPTLLVDLELVATPRPTDLAAFIAPALTRLSRLVVDTGCLEGRSLWGEPPRRRFENGGERQSVGTVSTEMVLMDALADDACRLEAVNRSETEDMSTLLGASASLQTLVLCGTGAYFSWGQGAALGRAAALKSLDLRGCHNHRWPPQAVCVACPALADLLLGFNGRCVEGAGEGEFDHCGFNLAFPPSSSSLTRVVLQNVELRLYDLDPDVPNSEPTPAGWAAEFASNLPGLAMHHVDDRNGWVHSRAYHALSFVGTAFRGARQSPQAGVLALVRDGHPFFEHRDIYDIYDFLEVRVMDPQGGKEKRGTSGRMRPTKTTGACYWGRWRRTMKMKARTMRVRAVRAGRHRRRPASGKARARMRTTCTYLMVTMMTILILPIVLKV